MPSSYLYKLRIKEDYKELGNNRRKITPRHTVEASQSGSNKRKRIYYNCLGMHKDAKILGCLWCPLNDNPVTAAAPSTLISAQKEEVACSSKQRQKELGEQPTGEEAHWGRTHKGSA